MTVLHQWEAGESRPWTAHEDAVLVQARDAGTPWPEVARALGRTVQSVKGRAKVIRAVQSRDPRRPWTQEEDQALLTAAHRGELDAYAVVAGRSIQGVRRRLRRLGAAGEAPRYWESVELAYLYGNHQQHTISQIGEALGRTPQSVSRKLSALGLSALLDNRPWTPEEDEVLRRLDGVEIQLRQAERLGRTRSSVKARRVALGLVDRPDGDDLPPLQGPYPTATTMHPSPWHWTPEQQQTMVEMLVDGATLEEVADAVGRSYRGVSYRARKLGLPRRSPGSPGHQGRAEVWGPVHDRVLRDNLGRMSHQEIAWRLGRTTSAVRHRAEKIEADQAV